MESHQYTVPDTVAVEPTFLLSFSTRKHASIASRVILSIFFEDQLTQTTHDTFGIVACTSSDNFSRNKRTLIDNCLI